MDKNEAAINAIQEKGFLGRLVGYAQLTGPGWLQSAVTLGGGSLAGALYLGVVAGYSLMWVQPLAMLCGVIMLMALAHVTLSAEGPLTPYDHVKKSISPVLAWGWLGATVIADIVFCTAQSSLGVATVQQNLGLSGVNPFVITTVLSVIAFTCATLYALGRDAAKTLERILKLMVALVMLSFAASAGLLVVSGRVDLGALFAGFIPNVLNLFKPADSLQPLIEATGAAAAYWEDYISNLQRDRIIAAFGAAVGINMTFLLPYTLIKRKWTKSHRQLSRYDLVLALLIPFSVATALLVISAASAFHAKDGDVLQANGKPFASLESGYYMTLQKRLATEGTLPSDPDAVRALADALPEAERRLAASLANRDARQLADTLAPVLGERVSHIVFGLGVLAMALSTMMVHTLMNGFAISQAVGAPGEPKPFIIGAAMPALLAIFAPLAWTGDAKTALVIPAVIIATVFLPIAYLAILLLMNSRNVLKPEDRAKPLANVLIILSAGVASFASVWTLMHNGIPGTIGIIGLTLLAVIGIGGFLKNQRAGVP